MKRRFVKEKKEKKREKKVSRCSYSTVDDNAIEAKGKREKAREGKERESNNNTELCVVLAI